MSGPKLLAFCHIEKCGGTTLIDMLRRSLPFGHFDIIPRDKNSNLAGESDLDAAFRLNPSLISIAGHGLRPYGAYGRYAKRMQWYTVLREPVSRMISDYRNDCRARGFNGTLTDWAQHSHIQNFITRSLSETGDVEEAKDVLQNRFAYFGLMNEFENFVRGLREIFHPCPLGASYTIKNQAEKAKLERRGVSLGREISDADRAAAMEASRLDIELWDFAVKLKKAERMQAARPEPGAQPASAPISDSLRLFLNLSIRNLIYKPMIGYLPGEVAALPRSRVNVAEYGAMLARAAGEKSRTPALPAGMSGDAGSI